MAKTVQAPRYDLTVFKIHWGNLTLKIYDKGARVLRIEVVVHNTKDLRCGKVLEKLPILLERMRGMLVRFLNTVQAAHVSFLDEGIFERWSEPSARGHRRLAGIDLNKARNRHVLNAVVTLASAPDGFTVAEVAAKVRERSGWNEDQHAGVTRPRGRPPKTIHPIDQHYIRLREELHDTFETLGLAA